MQVPAQCYRASPRALEAEPVEVSEAGNSKRSVALEAMGWQSLFRKYGLGRSKLACWRWTLGCWYVTDASICVKWIQRVLSWIRSPHQDTSQLQT